MKTANRTIPDYFGRPLDYEEISQDQPIDPSHVNFQLDLREASLDPLHTASTVHRLEITGAGHLDLARLTTFRDLIALSLYGWQGSDLSPLSSLSSLRALVLFDPPMLIGLQSLSRLDSLSISHFSHVRSLAPIASLRLLRALSLSTTAGWDASRRCLLVESFAPLAELTKLQELHLMGVQPLDNSLLPLHGLKSLRHLSISHVYQFGISDYSALASALPDTEGDCLRPYYALPQLHRRCRQCQCEIVFLTGPRPRTRRTLCPQCNAEKLAQHVRAWEGGAHSVTIR